MIIVHSHNSIIENLREFTILIRIQNLGTSITAIMGALSVKGINLEISHVILLFMMGILINISGQIHNDIKDLEIDNHSKELTKRPLVKGTITTKSAWMIVILSLIILFIMVLISFKGILPIILIFASILFGFLYNSYSKKIPGADVFLSASFAIFCLFGALVVSDNMKSFQDIGSITWVIVGLVFIHVQIMNSMQGGLKDAKNDLESGAKTLAVFLGVKANKELHIPLSFKAISMFFVVLTIILASIPFLFLDFEYSVIQLILMVLATVGMLFSAVKLLNMKTYDRKKIKFHIRNHEITRYSFVPIILLESIGVVWVLFLILFPLFWFIIFNYIFYRDSWSNPKTY